MSAAMRPVLCVVGARPNLMKIAPVLRAFAAARPALPAVLLHTGQHYSADLDGQHFAALALPEPEIRLEVGSGSHAQQTSEIMRRFEPVLDQVNPSAVLVVGDVNSTVACALVAAKKNVPVVHVEAGLRSFDRAMPEEINRIVTDQLSDLLFTTEASAAENLLREGIDATRIRFVGNVMIDSLRASLAHATPAASTIVKNGGDMSWLGSGFAVLTLHRPANVDDPDMLRALLGAVRDVGGRLPVLFPLHPRTRASLERHGLIELLDGKRIVALPPLGYLEMLGLMRAAKLVLTDSGGIQEETTALGVPCVTLRDNTERPVTIHEGTNELAGRDPERIVATVDHILRTGGKRGRVPDLWDGRAAERIALALREWLEVNREPDARADGRSVMQSGPGSAQRPFAASSTQRVPA